MHVFMGNHKVAIQDSGAPRGEKNHWVVELNDVAVYEGYNGAQAHRTFDVVCEGLDRVKVAIPAVSVPQPPQVLPNPPSHETSYANNLTQALHERDTLRDVLALLAPDLKAMAILYAQKGDHTRSQALANICKSVGVL